MASTKIIALAIGAIGLGVGALMLRKQEEGEPAPPIPLPDVPEETFDVGTPKTPVTVIPTAGYSNEVEALARVIASEAGSGTLAEQKAIGWTVRNRFKGKSIYDGEYPWRSQKGNSPPFASARPATDATRKLAAEILAMPQSQDPTNGATAFFEPKMQDIFAKAGELARSGETGDRVIDGQKLTDITRFKNYKKSADDIRKSWSDGSALFAKAGRFEFWGSARLFAQHGGNVVTVAGFDLLGA